MPVLIGSICHTLDLVDPSPTLVYSPASGGDETVFPLFVSVQISCTSADASGNSEAVVFFAEASSIQ